MRSRAASGRHLDPLGTLPRCKAISRHATAAGAGQLAACRTSLRAHHDQSAHCPRRKGSVDRRKLPHCRSQSGHRPGHHPEYRSTTVGGGPGVAITGYQIGSAGGALKPAAFASAFGGAWQSANLTVNSISELNPTGNSDRWSGRVEFSRATSTIPLRLETTFGTTPVADLTFSYSGRTDVRSTPR